MLKFESIDWKSADPFKSPVAFFNLSLLDADSEIRDAVIVIEKNQILAAGPRQEIEKQVPAHALKIDATGILVAPGLVNAHTHCSLSYLRSLGHGQKQMIETLFFKTEVHLSEELVEKLCYSDLVTGLKSGVTCFVDHYYFHRGTARAVDRVGLRGVISDTLLDVQGPFHGTKPWIAFQESLKNWNFSTRIKPCIGPHATNTTSPKFFKELAAFAKANSLPIHFHLSQTQHEWDLAQKDHGKSPVRLAYEAGALGEHSQAVHLLYVNEDDLKLLKDTGSYAAFCPSSQVMYERLAPIDRFMNADLKWTLGTDCAASNDLADMLSEMKVAALFAQDRGISPVGLAKKVLRAATASPAECFGLKTGLLKAGYLADLIFLPLGIQSQPSQNLAETLVFSLNAQQLHSVMVDGHWKLWDGEPIGLDLSSLTQEYLTAVREMQKRIQSA